MKDFYFYNWVLAVFLFLIDYMVLLRGGMYDYFRLRKVSKTAIRKSTKSMRNYWWYEQLHEEFGFNGMYWLNKIFTIAAIPTLALHTLLGWWKPMSIPAAILFSFCLAVSIPMTCFSCVQHNLYYHGRVFVLLERPYFDNQRGRWDSFIFDLIWIFTPFCLIGMELSFLNKIWHFI